MTNSYKGNTNDYVYHNENQVIQIICSALRHMLMNQGYATWQVARTNQPTIQGMQNNTVYVDIISKRRIGVQGNKPLLDQYNVWRDATVWLEEWLIQVSAFKQRDPDTDTPTTLTSIDIATILQATINGGGMMPTDEDYRGGVVPTWWPYSWLNVIRSTEVREIDIETDSGLKEKFPQFDFTLVVEQGLLRHVPSVDDIELKVNRV